MSGKNHMIGHKVRFHSSRIRKQKAGFTLVEILAALAFLSIALLGIHQGQAGSIRLTKRAEMKARAIQLAQMKMTETEIQVQKKGFSSMLDEEKGEFENKAYENFRWVRKLSLVNLGCFMPATASAEETGQAGFFEQAQRFFEESVRKIEIAVQWEEGGSVQQATLQQLYVDFRKLPSF